MAHGKLNTQRRFDDPLAVLGDRLKDGSIYKLLAEHGHELFADGYVADCYSGVRDGRPTVPPRILAMVMLLQAFEGLSDREATDRLGSDMRWQAAAGVAIGAGPSHPTVLVGARNRPRASERRGGCSRTPRSSRKWPERSDSVRGSSIRRRSSTPWRQRTRSPSSVP